MIQQLKLIAIGVANFMIHKDYIQWILTSVGLKSDAILTRHSMNRTEIIREFARLFS